MVSKKYFIFSILVIASFFLGAQFYKQEIWPFGRAYDDTLKKIVKYGFDYKNIVSEETKVRNLRKFYLDLELNTKKSLKDITATKEEDVFLADGLVMSKYLLEPQTFAHGIAKMTPGSGYLDFYDDKLFILSSRGILGYSENLGEKKIEFKQVENNLNSFLNKKQFLKGDEYESRFSFKDLTIIDNSIFISYTEEILSDCWNTGVIFSKINYKKINFMKLFSSTDCVKLNRKFNAQEAGGRIVGFDNDHILLSIGAYGRKSGHLSQDISSVNGKIIKINIQDTSYEIISLGHRNPEGLYYDKTNNFLLETEHGPAGGDEINMIKFDNLPLTKKNYGWPLASYGAHYGKTLAISKSHKEKGFIEPLKYFVPSIGISEITKVGKKTYVIASMANKALWFFKLDAKNMITKTKRISIKERIRDLKFIDKKLFLYLEDTASIGIIPLVENFIQ
jgi:hypothetical protein